MTKTKKSFMLAGGILGIVEASCLILSAISIFFTLMYGEVDPEILMSIMEAEEIISAFTPEEMEMMFEMMGTILLVASIVMLIMGALILTFSILVLNQRKNTKSKKGAVITLLVLSVLNGDLLIAGFMIVVLCLKDKTPQELVEQQIQINNQNNF